MVLFLTRAMDNIFFNSWENLYRTAIIGLFAYLGLILMLRVAGSRTLSQLNAFDLIVTVALGSTLSTVILNRDIALAEGLFALALLILFQLTISVISVRSRSMRNLIKTEPRILFYKGKFVKEALKDCRITKEEILQMIRSEGKGTMKGVDAVVLETNGRFSVIKSLAKDKPSVMANVR